LKVFEKSKQFLELIQKLTLVALLLESRKAKKKYLENYKFYYQKIKNIAKERLKKVKGFSFLDLSFKKKKNSCLEVI